MNEDQQSLTSAKLLLVEDNPVVSYFLEQILINDGYQVIRAGNGMEALDRLAEDSVDLILSDIFMPKMDGGQLCYHVRNKLELNTLPFIILTATEEAGEVARIYSLGIDDYLHKPCQPDLLLAVIRSHLNRAKTKKQDLEQKLNRFRKRIINTLSHEFRTPLMAINAGAELLIGHRDIEGLKDTVELVRAIQRGGERLEGLVNDFMCLQHLEAGFAHKYYEQNLSDVSLDELLGDLRKASFVRFNPNLTEFTFTNLAHGLVVTICKEQVIDALMRLIDNSLKFGPREGPVVVIFKVRESQLYLSVQDHGPGFIAKIPELNSSKALKNCYDDAPEMFAQLNREILEQQGGGLGLAIAKGYTEIHGGALIIEESKEGGAIVSLRLPI